MTRTIYTLTLALTLTACMDDVVIPPITTSGTRGDTTADTSTSSTSTTTAAETSTTGDPWCPEAYACVVLGDLKACEECKACGEPDSLACADFQGCKGLGYDDCECAKGACATAAWAVSCFACEANCDACPF